MKKNNLMAVILILLLVLVLGYFLFIKIKPSHNFAQNPVAEINQNDLETASSSDLSATLLDTASSTEPLVIKYQNDQYGFIFSLPLNWKNYSIVSDKWTGQFIDSENNPPASTEGPKILIRHPEWAADNMRQDIPIMIFTNSQWELVQQEKIAVSAAPIGPRELGRNNKYVFALPARYNFAFLPGFEEVEEIIQNNPLSPIE